MSRKLALAISASIGAWMSRFGGPGDSDILESIRRIGRAAGWWEVSSQEEAQAIKDLVLLSSKTTATVAQVAAIYARRRRMFDEDHEKALQSTQLAISLMTQYGNA